MKALLRLVPLSFLCFCFQAADSQTVDAPRNPTQPPEGWSATAPRDEIRPQFAYDPKGGPDQSGSFLITAQQQEGLQGCWQKSFPIKGGQSYRFHAVRKVDHVALPRRSAVVRILWRDAQGKPVRRDTPVPTEFLRGTVALAEPEYPTDKETEAHGWTEVSDTFRAPSQATHALVELYLQWAPGGKIAWSKVSLTESTPLPGRKVRLAAVHFRPSARTPEGNCRQFAPLIEDAARQHADLVVLPETLTYYGTGLKPADTAEPIPGPATNYLGELAKKHNLYIVAGRFERAAPLG
jgi:hypothetical protein